ncbi:hypothetical protein LTR62_000948 [Meristemomyces frigidus]|uniref:DNA damage-binding protein 1 n=1 Tax=Meristemomyces frigidus TaxID=1508187 RepID=A0AAN7YMN1_9PEZI|nr:hypothetical protein LTR62_000948 [Meristemomyces frigidus]
MAYLAPIHRPSGVRHAIQISFLAPDSDDLIVAKANRLEIWSANPQQPSQLSLQHSKTIYGKVTILRKLRPATSQTDHLFVATDRYHYFTLSWDASGKELKTEKSYVDVAEKAGRDSQTGDRACIDPSNRFMTLECYEGVVNILPIAHAGKGKRKAADNEVGELRDPVPVRIPELFVRSTTFVHKRVTGPRLAAPELAILYEESTGKLRLKVRELEYQPSLRPQEEPPTAELEKGRDAQGEIELGASHLISLPAPMYGLLIVGETSIAYADEWEYRITDRQPLDEATVFVAWCAIDSQRYAIADDYGKFYLLFIHQNSEGEYAGHQLDVLGTTSRASTLVYLDAGRIFVGSHQGDSQIIQISERSLEVVQTFPNLAPILDFTIMDMGNRSADAPVNEFSSGQARLVTGSGAYTDGSLRSIRSGVGLEDVGAIGDMGAPVTQIFSLKSKADIDFVDTLIVSFVSQTRIFKFEADGDVEEVQRFGAFDLGQVTLYAGNLAGGRCVQVTSSHVLVTQSDQGDSSDRWNSPGEEDSITAVAAEQDTIILSLGGATLIVLDVSGSNIKQQAQRHFSAKEQVSCISLSASIPNTCIAGFWQESKVAFLSLTDLTPIASTSVADEADSQTVPRSLAIAQILPDQPPTLFIGLADGNVVTYTIESAANPFVARKSIILGTQQANFALLPRSAQGLQNVFATCEHPSLIYGQDGRMVYSAVTASNAQAICSFDCEAFPGAIAIATEDEGLKLAMVDEERTTHVQTLQVGQTVRRIAYSPELKAFGLGTIARRLEAGREEVQSFFKLVDEVAFQELHSFALKQDELVECVIRCQLDDGTGTGETAERFVLGTAYLDDAAAGTATRGRLLVLEVTESRQLRSVTEVSLRGACRCVGIVRGRIVAALVKTVVVYALEYQSADSSPILVKKAAYRTATAPIDLAITGSTIAVTDLMKSLSLVEYKPGLRGAPDTLVEVGRHFETLWGTAVAPVVENTYLVSDAEGNLVVLQRDPDGFSEEERRRLRIVSEISLGEMVNRIRPITLTPSVNALVVPRAFVATVEGGVYVFCLIAPGSQDLLIRLQSLLIAHISSPGHVPFEHFRGFRNGVRDSSEEGPVRFVDGEVVEAFLDAGLLVQESVCKELGRGVEEVRGLVEGLRRVR